MPSGRTTAWPAARQFTAVARLTCRAVLREPVTLLVTLACVFCSLVSPLLIAHQLGQQARLAQEGALAFHFVFGLCLAAYGANRALGEEIRSGTASAVISKAVGRSVFLLAKFAGVAAALLVYSVPAAAATLVSDRMAARDFVTDRLSVAVALGAPALALAVGALVNRLTRRPFSSTALAFLALCQGLAALAIGSVDRQGQWAGFGVQLARHVLPASVLIYLALTIFAACALSLSTRLGAAPVFALLVALFAAGLVSDSLFRPPALPPPLVVLYGAIPNWQRYWLADPLSGDGVTWAGTARLAASAAFTMAGVLSLGMLSFRHRPL